MAVCSAMLVVGWVQAAWAADAIKLDYVPADAVGAVVLQPSRLMKLPEFELWPTEVITAVGLENAGIDPAQVELAIGVSGMEGWSIGEPSLGAVLHLTQPVDQKAVLAKLAPEAEPEQLEGKPFYRCADLKPLIVCFAGERTVIVATNEAYLKKMLTAKAGDTAIHKLLRRVDLTQHASAMVDFAKLRPLVVLALQQLPPPPAPFDEFLKLPELVSTVEMSIKLGNELDVQIAFGADDAAGATELKKLAVRGKEIARQFVEEQIVPELAGAFDAAMGEAMGRYIRRVTKFALDRIEVTQQEKQLILHARIPLGIAANGAAVSMLLPAVSSARAAAQRAQASNNLKQIGLAMHMYADTNNHLPPPAIRDKADKKALLSWRVAVLPYIEEGELYKEFHLDEPWDSDHNKKLIERMPAVFRSPSQKSPEGTTVYLAADGKGSMFEGPDGTRFREVTDGTSNTIMAVEADNDKAVIWTKPEDLKYDPKKPNAGLGHLRKNVFQALYGDGSVQSLATAIDADTLRAMFTRAGGEVVDRNR